MDTFPKASATSLPRITEYPRIHSHELGRRHDECNINKYSPTRSIYRYEVFTKSYKKLKVSLRNVSE